MKRIVSLLLAVAMMLGLMSGVAFADDKPTLRVLAVLHSEQTADIEDLFIFKHLENKFNINLELEGVSLDAAGERANLLLQTGDVYDLMWVGLSNSDAVKFGVDQGLLLDWTPYLTEELMPNAMQAKADYPDAFAASVAPDGGMYTLPYIRGAIYCNNTGAFSATIRVNINKEWLKACNLEKPTTLDEFINVLRVFKEKDPAGLGDQLVPCIDNQNKIKDFIWNALGFYAGTGGQTYGTNFAIKNEQVVLPAYTPEAKLFMETLKTMYSEGLVSPDYFTLDQTANRGIVSEGRVGVFGDSTLQPAENNWQEWDAMWPVSSSVNDLRVASINFGYSIGTYASADTEYPEIVAQIVDYLYSEEGAMFYGSGPMKGSPEEAAVEGAHGWYIKEDGKVTNDLIEANPTYTLTNGNSAYYYISGRFDWIGSHHKYAGVEAEPVEIRYIHDVLTGRDVAAPVTDASIWQDANWDHRWRISQTNAMFDYLTFIRLPSVYLTVEQEESITDLRMVIEDYITQETAKFITGARSMDEFEAYQAELKELGIEEYINLYKEAYAPFMAATFGE